MLTILAEEEVCSGTGTGTGTGRSSNCGGGSRLAILGEEGAQWQVTGLVKGGPSLVALRLLDPGHKRQGARCLA